MPARTSCLILPLLVLSLLPAASAQAVENWPVFRGPGGDGHAGEEALPTRWSQSEGITWKVPVHGRGWSSPVIWQDRIWMTTATPDGTAMSILCVDRDSGEILLDRVVFDVAAPREIHKFNTYSSPTPVVEEGRIYASWGSYGLACLDSDTGETLWVRRDLECNHYRGPGSSPIIVDDKLICHYDGFDLQYVVALDKRTGRTIWLTHRPHNFGTDDGDHKKAYATPLVIVDETGRRQLISPTSKGCFSYDVENGDEIWRVRYDHFSTAVRPLYQNGLVYITTGFSKGELLAIDPTGSGDVTETNIVWRAEKTMPSKPSPIIVDDLIYVINDQGVGTCLAAVTGEVVWTARVGGNFSASPIYGGGHIYFCNEEGETTVIRPGREYDPVAVNPLDEMILATPAAVDNALFIKTESHLYRIDARDESQASAN